MPVDLPSIFIVGEGGGLVAPRDFVPMLFSCRWHSTDRGRIYPSIYNIIEGHLYETEYVSTYMK
jgi:hypothetical protein